jgi:hypothetical protein
MFDKFSQKYVKQNQLVHSFEHMQAIHCRVPWLSNPIMTLSPKSNPTIIFFAKKKSLFPLDLGKTCLVFWASTPIFWRVEMAFFAIFHPIRGTSWKKSHGVFPMKDGGVHILIFSSNGSVSKPCTPGEHQNSW